MTFYADLCAAIRRGRDRGIDFLRRHALYTVYLGIIVGALFVALFSVKAASEWSQPREWGINQWEK